MSLEDFMLGGETVVYACPMMVNYSGSKYGLFVTNERFVLFKRRGLVFKRDDFIGERIAQVYKVGYKEKGAMRRKGVVTLETERRPITFEVSGNLAQAKTIYQELQQFWEKRKT